MMIGALYIVSSSWYISITKIFRGTVKNSRLLLWVQIWYLWHADCRWYTITRKSTAPSCKSTQSLPERVNSAKQWKLLHPCTAVHACTTNYMQLVTKITTAWKYGIHTCTYTSHGFVGLSPVRGKNFSLKNNSPGHCFALPVWMLIT